MTRTLPLLVTLMLAVPPALAQEDAYMGAFNDASRNIVDIAGNAAVSKSIRDDATRRQRRSAASLAPAQAGSMDALRAEYERRVRVDGRASADAWLRQVAAEMGRQAGRAERARRLGAETIGTTELKPEQEIEL